MPAVAKGSVMGHDPSFALDVVNAIIQSVPDDGMVMLSRAMRAVRAMSIAPLHDPTAVADIFVNTNLAAAGGVLACMIISKATNSHTNIAATLNGAIAGLVAITAEPLTPSIE